MNPTSATSDSGDPPSGERAGKGSTESQLDYLAPLTKEAKSQKRGGGDMGKRTSNQSIKSLTPTIGWTQQQQRN